MALQKKYRTYRFSYENFPITNLNLVPLEIVNGWAGAARNEFAGNLVRCTAHWDDQHGQGGMTGNIDYRVYVNQSQQASALLGNGDWVSVAIPPGVTTNIADTYIHTFTFAAPILAGDGIQVAADISGTNMTAGAGLTIEVTLEYEEAVDVKKISELGPSGTITSADQFLIARSGMNYRPSHIDMLISQNTRLAETASDLPAAVGGVRRIDKFYNIRNLIDIGTDVLAIEAGGGLFGTNPQLAGIISNPGAPDNLVSITDATPLFAPISNIALLGGSNITALVYMDSHPNKAIFNNCHLSCPTASIWNRQGSFTEMQFINCLFGAQRLGTCNGPGKTLVQGGFFDSTRDSGTPWTGEAISVQTNNDELIIQDLVVDEGSAGEFVKFVTTSTTKRIIFNNISFDTAGAKFAQSEDGNGAQVATGGQMRVTSCDFTGTPTGGSYLDNMSKGDPKTQFHANTGGLGMEDSTIRCVATANGTTTATDTSTTNTWVAIVTDSPLERNYAERASRSISMDITINDVITSTISYEIHLSAFRSVGAGTPNIEFSVFKNGVIDADSVIMTMEAVGAGPRELSFQGMMQVANGDSITPVARNITNTNQITVSDIVFSVKAAD